MVQDTLCGATSKRYRHSVRRLAECGACDVVMDDYRPVATHTQFFEALKAKHGRKYGVWQPVDK